MDEWSISNKKCHTISNHRHFSLEIIAKLLKSREIPAVCSTHTPTEKFLIKFSLRIQVHLFSSPYGQCIYNITILLISTKIVLVSHLRSQSEAFLKTYIPNPDKYSTQLFKAASVSVSFATQPILSVYLSSGCSFTKQFLPLFVYFIISFYFLQRVVVEVIQALERAWRRLRKATNKRIKSISGLESFIIYLALDGSNNSNLAWVKRGTWFNSIHMCSSLWPFGYKLNISD